MGLLGRSTARSMLAVLLGAVALSISGLTPVWPSSQRADQMDPAVRAGYEELVLDAAYDGCELLPASDPDHLGIFSSRDLLRAPLTEAERKLTGTFRRPGGSRISCAQSIPYIIHYHERFGRVPRDGIELLGLYTSKWFSAEGLEEFRRLSGSDAIWDTAACRCINPATGKFFRTFAAKVWEPCGLLVEPVKGEGAVKLIPAPLWDEQSGRYVSGLVPHQMWHVRVYGERPFTVLVDKEIGHPLDGGVKQGRGRCGSG